MARILLGVSGGIAAYKALEFIRLTSAEGHSLRVVQTPTSQRFVGEASFVALTGAPVLTDEFSNDPARGAFPGQESPAHQPLSHLALVANADLYLIAPASANTLAKLAGGHADNLLTSAALAATCPVVVAPAMNNHMYEHPATQANLAVLRERGVHLIEPDSGRLASAGEHGVGRLAEPARLLAVCERILAGKPHPPVGWVSPPRSRAEAGGSRARARLAQAGLERPACAGQRRWHTRADRQRALRRQQLLGAHGPRTCRGRGDAGLEVSVVAANVTLPVPAGVTVHRVGTAAELQAACEREFPSCDVLLMTAAVADFRPVDPTRARSRRRAASISRSSSSPPPTCSALSPEARARTDACRLRRRAWFRWHRACARKAHRQARRRGRLQRHLARGHRLRVGCQRGHDPHSHGS